MVQLNPTQNWTVSFVREWLPYMSLRSVLRLRDYELRSARGGQIEGQTIELRMKSPVRGTVSLREVGSDILTFNEVIKDEVYKSILQKLKQCETIIDLGANIGLASLYFAGHYPSCRLLAVEPNPPTYRVLTANLRNLIESGRCRTLQAAVWGSERKLVADPSQGKEHYSAFATREASGAEADDETMQGFPITSIIRDSGFETVDLLKVDIEGAEVELFKGDLEWLRRVRAIAIEFHHGSREEIGFDRIMRDYGFRIYDQNQHTVLAVREDEAAQA
jgi:FkbM family methyltransferase